MPYDAESIFAKEATRIMEHATDEVIDAGKKRAGSFRSRHRIKQAAPFEDYLTKLLKEYSKINTLLFRNRPCEFEDIYVAPNLRLTKYDNETKDVARISIPSEDVGSLLRLSNHLLITGTGGSGKTMFLRRLLLRLCIEASKNEKGPIPVPVILRRTSNTIVDRGLTDYILRFINGRGCDLSEQDLMHAFSAGRIFLLIDGLDELSDFQAQSASNELIRLCEWYPDMRIVLTARPNAEGYVYLPFTEIQIEELTLEQAIIVVRKYAQSKALADKFTKQLQDGVYENYQSFASNPLLLTVMLRCFRAHGEIPTSFVGFYEDALHVLFDEHDTTKDMGFHHEYKSKLEFRQFRTLFSYLCFHTFRMDLTEFNLKDARKIIDEGIFKLFISKNKSSDIDYPNGYAFVNDLTKNVCMLIEDPPRHLSFAHRSFQEYYAACYTQERTEIEDYVSFVNTWIMEHNFYTTINSEYILTLYNLDATFIERILVNPLQKLRTYALTSTEFLDFLSHGFIVVGRYNGAGGLIVETYKSSNFRSRVIQLASELIPARDWEFMLRAFNIYASILGYNEPVLTLFSNVIQQYLLVSGDMSKIKTNKRTCSSLSELIGHTFISSNAFDTVLETYNVVYSDLDRVIQDIADRKDRVKVHDFSVL